MTIQIKSSAGWQVSSFLQETFYAFARFDGVTFPRTTRSILFITLGLQWALILIRVNWPLLTLRRNWLLYGCFLIIYRSWKCTKVYSDIIPHSSRSSKGKHYRWRQTTDKWTDTQILVWKHYCSAKFHRGSNKLYKWLQLSSIIHCFIEMLVNFFGDILI